MQARLLLAIFDAVYLFSLTAWLGAVLFFSFGVAPVIFRTLGSEAGAKFVRALFPRYYAWGVVASAVSLPAFLGGPLSFPEYKGWWVGVQALMIVAVALTFLYCGNALTPAINAARDAGPEGAGRFDRLHKRSVRLNAAILLVGIILLVAQATRRPPTSAGIRELSAGERVLYDAEVQAAIERYFATGSTAGPEGVPRLDDAAREELEGYLTAKRDREAARRRSREKAEVPR